MGRCSTSALGALLAALAAAGCSEEGLPDAASSFPDAAARDGGADAATADAAPPDAAAPDAESPDTGLVDSGVAPRPPVQVDITLARPPALLSEYHFFEWRDGRFDYNQGVVPYELNTALFSDFALKARAIWLPAGTSIQYSEQDAFDFPVGSAIIKSFLFAPDLRQPERELRLVETRVLVRYPSGWQTFPYLWRLDGTDADYRPGGHVESISFIDRFGEPQTSQYLVPQRNQCLNCHELLTPAGARLVTIIGPKARHLNRELDYGNGPEGQLEHLAALGMLTGLPANTSTIGRDFDFASLDRTGTTALSQETIDKAARDYLDINCAHCHNPRAVQGVTSQLFLDVYNVDRLRLGICKEPGSAGSGAGGRRFDIVPGDPGASILHYRMDTEVVGEMMPLLGRSLRDRLGVGLVRGWIAGMPAESCD